MKVFHDCFVTLLKNHKNSLLTSEISGAHVHNKSLTSLTDAHIKHGYRLDTEVCGSTSHWSFLGYRQVTTCSKNNLIAKT